MKLFQSLSSLIVLLYSFPFIHSLAVDSHDLSSRQSNRFLRVLAIGDSITAGSGSTDGNSYRNVLRNTLTQRGNTVDMIGTLKIGTMVDNENEGHSGFIISQIASNSGVITSLTGNPNIVLLHIGTNDMNRNTDLANAPARLGSLIDQITTASGNATVLVAKIILSRTATTQANINAYNAAIPALVSARRNAGKRVVMVDMSTALTSTDLVDALHPSNLGYQKMAAVWDAGLQSASAQGLIVTVV